MKNVENVFLRYPVGSDHFHQQAAIFLGDSRGNEVWSPEGFYWLRWCISVEDLPAFMMA
jgi:hypothetical protein